MTSTAPQKKLSELFNFKNGRGFSKSEWSSKGLPIIRIQNLNDANAPFNYFDGEYSDDILVEQGDLLFSWSGTVGSSFGSHLWDREEGLLNQHIFKITPINGISKTYAYHGLRYITEEIEKSVSGAVGLVHITKARLNEFTLPVPSPTEQQRIVGILDEAFDGIATAKANAEKNLQNARALFESHVNAVFVQRGKSWPQKPLGDIAEFKNGLNFTRSSNGQTVLVVGVGDFQSHHIVPLDELDTVTIDGDLDRSYEIQQNDILTVRSNGSKDLVGRCMLVPPVNEVVSFSGFVIRIRCDAKEVEAEYLLHFMKSSQTRDRLTRDGGGTNISNINQAKLSTLGIPLPKRDEQIAVATSIDRLKEETQRLASIYQRKLAARSTS